VSDNHQARELYCMSLSNFGWKIELLN